MSLSQAGNIVMASRKRGPSPMFPTTPLKSAKFVTTDQVTVYSAKAKIGEEQMKQAIRSSTSLSVSAMRVFSVEVTICDLIANDQLTLGILRFVDSNKVAKIQKEMETHLPVVAQIPWGAFLPDSVDADVNGTEPFKIGDHPLALFEGNHRLQSILMHSDEAIKKQALSMTVSINIRLVPKDIFDKIAFTGHSIKANSAPQSGIVKTIPEDVLPFLREAHIEETIRLEDSYFNDNEEYPLISCFVRHAYSKLDNHQVHISRRHIESFVKAMIDMRVLPKNAKMAANLSFCPKEFDHLLIKLMKSDSIVLSYRHCWFNVVKLARHDTEKAVKCIERALDKNYNKGKFHKRLTSKAKNAQREYQLSVTPPEIQKQKIRNAERQRKCRAAKRAKKCNDVDVELHNSNPIIGQAGDPHSHNLPETPKSRNANIRLSSDSELSDEEVVDDLSIESEDHHESSDYEDTEEEKDRDDVDDDADDDDDDDDDRDYDDEEEEEEDVENNVIVVQPTHINQVPQRFCVDLHNYPETVRMAGHIAGKVVKFHKDDIVSLSKVCSKIEVNFRLMMKDAEGYILSLKSSSANAAQPNSQMMKLLAKWPTFVGLINDEMCVCGSATNELFVENMLNTERINVLGSALPLSFKPPSFV